MAIGQLHVRYSYIPYVTAEDISVTQLET